MKVYKTNVFKNINFRFCSEIPGISGTFTNTKAEIYGIPYIPSLPAT